MKSLVLSATLLLLCTYHDSSGLALKTIKQENNAALALLRGPYLQSATSTSIIIRWRTDQPATSRVSIGNAANALTIEIDDNNLTTDHVVKVSGLQAKTRYFYSIGSITEVLQGDANNYFETTPVPGAIGKYRIGVFGDCGTNSANQLNVRNQMGAYLGANYMDAWLLLGDNAYNTGTDAEFQSGFFNVYKDSFLKQNPLYPCPGNHDYANTLARQNDHAIPYNNIFSSPIAGEAGGVASGNNAYYSFDYGNIHFLSLDSYGREDNSTRLYDTLGKQVQWIKQDLAANANKDWVVAYWHHPPFTKGSHDSDTETELLKIRENFIRILERSGVDLILCGHSHDYERSKLMKGHYGLENSFDPSYHLSSSSGKYDGSVDSCPYFKKSASNEGTVYVVSGSAGQLGGSKAGYPHDALPFADATHGGATMMEVEGNRMDIRWVGADGVIRDQFTIEKDVNQKQSLSINKGESIVLNSSYIGNYIWSTGAATRSVNVTPDVDTQFIVKDGLQCLSDTFNIQVTNPLPVRLVSFVGAVTNQNCVSLNWQTAGEENADYFAIERSLNGIDFKEIKQVKAAGNAVEDLFYNWIDQNAATLDSKILYYRLREVDFNTKSQLSRIIAVRLNDPENVDVVIVPNPSSGNETQIKLIGAESLEAEIVLSNLSGHVFKRQAMTLTNTLQPLATGKRKAGIYFLKIKTKGRDIIKKLVIY
ncbi:metallophosphoesterase [Dyadobacter pollutisoli]|uniref:Metallophosphoesterase n=1 Tax=Dyadobacter pollutisoli TaxID=2910158 RepID=A0A9E8NE92_9BACT|nr:metallophosphoesterase [Dyadobacter pollutisoli]WAC15154.1 metallophosphoesterase [Dyadobacter pollutisoli]